MAETRVIYFTVTGRSEQAEISIDAQSSEIKDCLRSAAEAGPYDILKLYNANGNLMSISNLLPANQSSVPYKLEVVPVHCSHCCSKYSAGLTEVESRLQMLEKRVFEERGSIPMELNELKDKVDGFKTKLESVEHLSWLGLFKEMSIGPSALPYPKTDKVRSLRRSQQEYNDVKHKYLQMGSGLTSEEILDNLRRPTFNNWQWEDAEMMYLVQQMFLDLKLVETFNINMSQLQEFIFEVYNHYNIVPFHNFRHCFCVTQMMYGMICLSEVNTRISPHEVLIMLVAAFCHDLDHPGHNNDYQVNARTALAIRYNDISPLENHHSAVAFDILSQPHCNIFSNIEPELYSKIRKGIISLILATDMARHNQLLKEFKEILAGGFDWCSDNHRQSMLKTFIKAADVSNETRPMDVAEPWLECLLQEFFAQSDLEKLEGLPTSAFMDRDKVTKSSAQVGFIQFILIPLYKAMAELFPVFEEYLLKPINKAFDYYVQMGREYEEQRSSKSLSIDEERRRDREISRKLSMEFDKRLTEEIHRKFSNEHHQDIHRKISSETHREEEVTTPTNRKLSSHENHHMRKISSENQNHQTNNVARRYSRENERKFSGENNHSSVVVTNNSHNNCCAKRKISVVEDHHTTTNSLSECNGLKEKVAVS